MSCHLPEFLENRSNFGESGEFLSLALVHLETNRPPFSALFSFHTLQVSSLVLSGWWDVIFTHTEEGTARCSHLESHLQVKPQSVRRPRSRTLRTEQKEPAGRREDRKGGAQQGGEQQRCGKLPRAPGKCICLH